MSYMYLDFETRSPLDITKVGSSKYAASADTEILCLGWSYKDKSGLWSPHEELQPDFMGDSQYAFMSIPADLRRAVEDCDVIVCWNRQFDQLIYENILGGNGWPSKGWLDAALLARACNLPGSLGACADFLGYKQGKMKTGTNLIRALSIPPYQTSPELLQQMGEYCLRDVAVTRVLVEDEFLAMLPENYVEHLSRVDNENFAMGDLGVRVRVDFCRAATALAGLKNAHALEEISDLTDGEVGKLRGPNLLKWVSARLPDRHLSKITRERSNGQSSLSLDAEARQYLLAQNDLSVQLRRVIELVDAVSKSSVHKYQTMADMAEDDERVRHAIVTWGGQQTGRFSARGLQVHNFPRATVDDAAAKAEMVIGAASDGTTQQLIHALDADEGVHAFLSKMLRPTLIPDEGCVFVVADWSNIEGRIAPWLWVNALPDGDNHGASAKLQRFADQDKGGVGVYESTAADIFGVDPQSVDPEQRQIGKVAELALGYGGGVNAFVAMGRNYGITLDLDTASWVVDSWRETNPWAVRLWDVLDHAFRQAFTTGTATEALGGLLRYEKIVAPGGHTVVRAEVRGFDGGEFYLFYNDVRVEQDGSLTCAKANRRADKHGKWPRMNIWHGLLCENLVQALAADLLRYVISGSYPVVLHVHDEVVLEVGRGQAETWRGRLETAMEFNSDIDPWIPLRAEAKVMEAFGK